MKKLYETVRALLKDERGFLGLLALSAAMLGAHVYSSRQQEKQQKRALQQMEEDAAKNQVKTTIVDESQAAEERRQRNSLKQGRASTVLAGDYRQSATKRLLGE